MKQQQQQQQKKQKQQQKKTENKIVNFSSTIQSTEFDGRFFVCFLFLFFVTDLSLRACFVSLACGGLMRIQNVWQF